MANKEGCFGKCTVNLKKEVQAIVDRAEPVSVEEHEKMQAELERLFEQQNETKEKK